MFGVPDAFPAPRAEQRCQASLALLERQTPDVFAVQVQQVEDEVDEVAAITAAEGVLQRLKARAAVGQEHGHLAIEKGAPDGQLGGRGAHLGEPVGPVLAVAAEEGDGPLVDAAADPVAVELELVQPRIAFRCRAHQGRELGLEALRQGRGSRLARPCR